MTKRKWKIRIVKSQSRGDEISLLFCAIVVLGLLMISLIRFSALGKILDDVLFSFSFGWMKYGVYGFSLLLVVPLCFGYRIKIPWLSVLSLIIALVLTSWTIQTVSIITIANQSIWTNYYQHNLLNLIHQYCNQWWNSSVINNYHGFFSSPIIIAGFNIASFFPKYATGGIISNVLTGIFNYGTLVTNVVVNVISILCFSCYLFFNRPLLIFSKLKLIIAKIKTLTWPKIKKNNLQQAEVMVKKPKNKSDKQELKPFKNKQPPTIPYKTQTLQNILKKKQEQIKTQTLQSQVPISPVVTINLPYDNENSCLTPFGKINPETNKTNKTNSKGTLVIKQSLEDSVLNNQQKPET